MRRELREVIADWLLLFGAVALLVSLFLPWSHQFSRAFLAQWAHSGVLRDFPRDPTAWQVYSVADVILALLAGGLIAVAAIGGRLPRLVALAGSAIALAFAAHALSVPPTNGANLSVPGFVANVPSSASGEVVAVAALGTAIVGLLLSFAADLPS